MIPEEEDIEKMAEKYCVNAMKWDREWTEHRGGGLSSHAGYVKSSLGK